MLHLPIDKTGVNMVIYMLLDYILRKKDWAL